MVDRGHRRGPAGGAGPHPEVSPAGTFAALSSSTFTVGADSNRIGLRLRAAGAAGAAGIRPADHAVAELDSQGTVTGAVQSLPDGQPVILLPDHADLGGYPVLAVVATADHGLLGQSAPGTRCRNWCPSRRPRPVGPWAARRRRLDAAVVGHYPLAVD